MISRMAAEPRVGTIIKRARLRKRWTQQRLADAADVSLRTVNDWENGRAYPRNPVAVEEALGISLGPGPEEPFISPELRAMIEALGPEERAWVMEQLTAADRRLRRRGADQGNSDPDQGPAREAAG